MIRLLTIEDYEVIYELWQSAEGMGLRSLDDSKNGIEKFIIRNPKTNFIALNDDEVTGVILSGHDGRRGYIYHAVVSPKYRGKNIGKSLVDHVIESQIGEGINKICLVVFKDNEPGNKFWEAIGFDNRDDLIFRNISINDLNL